MRRIVILGVALAVLLPASVVSVNATSSGPSGTYLTPFREDGAAYVNGKFQNGSYLGQPTDNTGCVAGPTPDAPAGNPLAYRCMPAGASMVLLADGRILYWDALEGTENIAFLGTNTVLTDLGRLSVNDESRLLTLGGSGPSWAKPSPVDGGAHNPSTAEDLPLPAPLAATHYPYNNAAMFCSDQVLLADGTVLDVGGTDFYSEPTIPGTNKGIAELQGVRNSRVFYPATNTWAQGPAMNYGRWYPSLVTLGNGQVLVASGVTKLIKPFYPTHLSDSLKNVEQTETFDPVNKVWVNNGPSANRALPLFPRLHLLPDGHVYYDAGGQDFNPAGQSIDEALWNVAGSYDPATKSWTDLGVPGLLTPGINPLFAGFRGSTFSAALALRPDASMQYNRASYLTAGGVLLPSPGSVVSVADSRIDTVSTTGGSDHLTTTPTGPLARGRWYGTAVPLPDGTVYMVSGADIDEVVAPGLESPITSAERFVPTLDASGNYTGGHWISAGSQDRMRTYHNNALLLPDGSVLIGGHAPIPFLYGQVHDGISLPGRPGTNNSHDASFQIYRPPYFDSPRPSLDGVAEVGRTLVLSTTASVASIASVVAVRDTAQTHLVDGDARTVSLPIIGRGAGTVTVQLPDSSNVLPAGPYMLFMNQNTTHTGRDIPGEVVPSIAKMVSFAGATPTLG